MILRNLTALSLAIPVLLNGIPARAANGLQSTASASTSSNDESSENHLGLRLGTSLSNIHESTRTPTPIEYKSRLGIAAAVSFEHDFSASFAFATEIAYIQKGIRVDYEYEGNRVTGDADLDYLELPLLAKFQYPLGSTARIFLLVGPYAALAVNKSLTTTENGQSKPGKTDSVRDWDWGAQLGTGASIAMSRQIALILSVRYERGLLDLNRTSTQERTTGNTSWIFQSGLSYSL